MLQLDLVYKTFRGETESGSSSRRSAANIYIKPRFISPTGALPQHSHTVPPLLGEHLPQCSVELQLISVAVVTVLARHHMAHLLCNIHHRHRPLQHSSGSTDSYFYHAPD